MKKLIEVPSDARIPAEVASAFAGLNGWCQVEPDRITLSAWTPWDSEAAKRIVALGGHETAYDQWRAELDPDEQSVAWYWTGPRLFRLVRDVDETGVSGVGVVADGVVWPDKTCALRWRTRTSSTAVYKSIDDVITIHGHQGKTRVEWA